MLRNFGVQRSGSGHSSHHIDYRLLILSTLSTTLEFESQDVRVANSNVTLRQRSVLLFCIFNISNCSQAQTQLRQIYFVSPHISVFCVPGWFFRSGLGTFQSNLRRVLSTSLTEPPKWYLISRGWPLSITAMNFNWRFLSDGTYT